jgi:rhamnogalacturonyl hydrolase YesR
VPLSLTATNSPSAAAQQSATQFWAAAAGWVLQRMPSLEVITRLPVPLPATQA